MKFFGILEINIIMVVLLEDLSRPLLATDEAFTEFNTAATDNGGVNGGGGGGGNGGGDNGGGDNGDDNVADLPSCADELSRLQGRYQRLQEENLYLRSQLMSHSTLLPADTLDLALLVSVVALVVFVGKVALSK